MLQLKGFMNITELVKNDKFNTSPIGELSTYSRTYSKDVGEYISADIPGYVLYSFSSTDSITKAHVVLTERQADHCFTVINTIYMYNKTNVRPFDRTTFINTIRNLNSQTVDILEIGDFKDSSEASLPEWVEFNNKNTGDIYRIWLADEAFQNQYDLFEIDVVTVYDNADDFFKPYESILGYMSDFSITRFIDKVKLKRDINPETVFHVLEFAIRNKNNQTMQVNIPWGVLIYGSAGDNIDSIKDAIEDYLVDNSNYSREEWEFIFPGIFKRIEFSIFPIWDKIAIPNLTELTSVYSSIISIDDELDSLHNKTQYLSPGYLLDNAEILPHHYKYVTLMAIAGDGNEYTHNKLAKVFKDYTPVPNTSLDFGRMTKRTRDWCELLYTLVKEAETATRYNTLAPGIKRLIRRDKVYVSAEFENINYLVYSKTNG